MSSKADDFDVRYRGTGAPGHGRPGTVDYDLGYDAPGWDTDGFRSVGTALRPGHGRTGSNGDHAGTAGTAAAGTGPPNWDAEATRAMDLWAPGAPEQPGGPDQPSGPAGPRWPDQPGRPRRRRADRAAVKVKGSWWRRWTLRKAIGVLLGLIGAVAVLGAIVVVMAYDQTPVPSAAMAATGYSQSVVYSADGTLIGRFGTTNRQMLKYGQIPGVVREAVLAAEDRNFFTEGGIAPTAIIRAAYADVRGSDGSLQGGSTITQQFVRNYYAGIGTQQTLGRKIKEIFVAMKVAKEKSKQWILENYLNTIYLGEGAYGIGAAAETYYDEPVTKLSVAQAAVIAAIIQQPSTYPLPQYRAELENRWHYVLNGMVQMGALTAQQAATVKFPVPGDHVPQSVGADVWDPYVLEMVKNELLDVYHFSQSQIDDGGYVIRTTIDDAKMAALYKAVQQDEQQMAQGGVALPDYAHVGAVLEDPATGAIQAMYPGPGYPGSRYVDQYGSTHTMTARECKVLDCEVNMAVYNREQVGSSFKPYVLATAVSQGMNVQTSTLDGYDPLWIPPDSDRTPYSSNRQEQAGYQWYKITNDSAAENGPFTPQMAMAASINTAYADLWHRVGGAAVARMAQLFGVNTDAAGITGPDGMEHEAGIALGQASLTVAEQATMLATIDDGGVYHDAHVIGKITQNGMRTPVKVISYPVFSSNPAQNTDEATQVQYAMSVDTAPYGTAPTAAMSNGQEIIAKTGTTNHFQSAFFIGAMPTQALAVGIFADKSAQSLPSDLGGNSQGGYGGTWPASIWHTYAENMFVPLGAEQFQQPVFTGAAWNQVPPGLRTVVKPHKKQHGHGPGGGGPPTPGNPNPSPYPTYSCNPALVTCGGPGAQSVNATPMGAAAGGIIAGLPATSLWARRRRARRRG